MEVAKRAVLEVLDCSLAVAVTAVGVEWTGRISLLLSSVDVWSETVSGAMECSNSGREGKDDGSPSSWILRHILDGVSYKAINTQNLHETNVSACPDNLAFRVPGETNASGCNNHVTVQLVHFSL